MNKKFITLAIFNIAIFASTIYPMDFIKSKFAALKKSISPDYEAQAGNKACGSVQRMLGKIQQQSISTSLGKEHKELIENLEEAMSACSTRNQAVALYEENPDRKAKKLLIKADDALVRGTQGMKKHYKRFNELNKVIGEADAIPSVATATTLNTQAGNKACMSFGRMLAKMQAMSVHASIQEQQAKLTQSLQTGVEACNNRERAIAVYQQDPTKINVKAFNAVDHHLVEAHQAVKEQYKAITMYNDLKKTLDSLQTAQTAAAHASTKPNDK